MKKIVFSFFGSLILLSFGACDIVDDFLNSKEDLKTEILDTVTNETMVHIIIYGHTLEDITYHHEGLTLIGYKKQLDDTNFDITTPIYEDLKLYTVFETIDGFYHVIFETNIDLHIVDQVVEVGNLVIKPSDPVHDTLLFYGWYLEPSFNNLFEFDVPITQDLTLYAKFIDKTIHTYEIEDMILSWEPHPNASIYHVYVGEVLFEVSNAYMDISTLDIDFLGATPIIVFAVFETDQTYELFKADFKYEYLNPVYTEDFESSSFQSRTNYSNNTTPRSDGETGNVYHILNGSASTTNPIGGTKSIQLRNGSNTPYLETQFYLENIELFTFSARSYNHNLKVIFISTSGEILESYDVILSESIETYQLPVKTNREVQIRFELLRTSDVTTGEQVFIDDIYVYEVGGSKELVEVVTEGIPDDELEAIFNRFASHRNNLTPPGFNALSSEGLIEYYASLNGLTGHQFKTELTNILTTTHRRLISYDEARFVLEQSDLVTIGDKNYLDGIYSGHEIIPFWDGGATWAREHVWPNSRLAMNRVTGSGKNQGSDVHNLRAINPSVNSSRSNRYFLEADSFGLVGTEAYYPGEAYKGYVARILFYMLARYPDILTLRDEDIIDNAYEADGAVMGILSLLIKWHKEDPVSDFEIHRNNVIHSYQGNRNPFIDNPEYVDVYFN